jgi:hypothetical protein
MDLPSKSVNINGDAVSIELMVVIMESLQLERPNLFEFLKIIGSDISTNKQDVARMIRQMIRDDYGNYSNEAISKRNNTKFDSVDGKTDAFLPSAPLINMEKLSIDSNLDFLPPPIPTMRTDSATAAYMLAMTLEEEERKARENFFCHICQDEHPINGSFTLDCSHRFCQEGLTGYICSKINNNQVTEEDLICPFVGCQTAISHVTVKACTKDVGDIQTFDKYDRFATDHYIEKEILQGNVTRCPNQQCVYAFQWRPDGRSVHFECPLCKQNFCLNCSIPGVQGSVGPGHQPYSCSQQIQRMREVAAEKAKFEEWKVLNARANELFEQTIHNNGWRRCPSCASVIERNQGCDHMTCKQCKCNFCYICGKFDRQTPTNRGDCGSTCRSR